MYETRKDSPALYWLRSDQTSDGSHPFLITNNKKLKSILNKWFCGPNLRLMSIEDICTLYPEMLDFCLMTKSQGYLLATRWATTKAFNNFTSLLTELKLCNNNLMRKDFLFHLYTSNRVLPVAKLWWLHRMFPLDEQTCENRTVAQKVAQNWAGGLVTCTNFQHLWLSKSFSTFISRRIIHRMYKQNLIPNEMSFLERITAYSLINKINLLDLDSEQKLVPNLRSILPKDITKCVIDELGYILLNYLEYFLGPVNFELYLQSYFSHFRFKSINTNDWLIHLSYYFVDVHKIISFHVSILEF
ncbi:LKHA4 aminopeptidase, partial [Acromyrmex charruanus]